ncbi:MULTISPECIES: IS4 family transposase [unclassified Microbulbifer]|uniref:IS4 family transposase n=1 Tax=unclassified Microbulbifer TaxID=2619833 RepID=UPI0027E56A41|nr:MULTISPECIES: IS4 family transposase [unclassified Microbulbifer]
MHPNKKHASIQRCRIKKCAERTNSYDFFNLLTSKELFEIVEGLLPDHRERTFPPTETLSMFLAQAMHADRSCQNIVNQAAIARLTGDLPPISTGTSAYCKARKRLPLEMISELVRFTGKLTSATASDHWKWRGRPVKLIDGTTTTMPDTVENQKVFPQQQAQAPGLGFPICRIVGVVCLGSGTILDAGIGPYRGKGSGEQSLLRSIIGCFEEGDVAIGDACYPSYFLLAELVSKGVDCIFEQNGMRKKLTDFRKGKRLGPKDHLVTYCKPKQKPNWMTEDSYRAAPDSVTMREIKVGGKILVTTFLSEGDAPRKAIKDLYKSRWHIELDFRNIKTTLGMEILSCKTPDMVIKEIWVYFLAHNLIRTIMAEAASLSEILPRQLSFKHCLQLWQACRQRSFDISDNEKLLVLLHMIAKNIVGNRPGRIEPRAIKRRPKPYSLLMLPREQARAYERKHGHPPKQRMGLAA